MGNNRKNTIAFLITSLSRQVVICLGLLFILTGLTVSAAALPCSTERYQTAARKVYRDTKMYLEGLADFTGDGRPDAYGYQLQPNNTFKNVVILPNDGSGGFGDPIIIPTNFPIANDTGYAYGRFYGGLVVSDLNGDGKKDLIVRGGTSPLVTFTVLNNGGGSFTVQGLTILDTLERVVDTADVNGDGRMDLITSLMQPGGFTNEPSFPNTLNGVYYRIGDNSGNFGAMVQISNAPNISATVADYDNDGRTDVSLSYYASANSGGDNHQHFKVMQNLGQGIFNGSTPTMTMDSSGFREADLNNDGKMDLYGFGPLGLHTLINNGGNVFTENAFTLTDPIGFAYREAAPTYLVDYDGDGDKDIVVPMNYRKGFAAAILTRRYAVMINDGAGNFTRTDVNRPFNGIPIDIDGDNVIENVDFVNSSIGAPMMSGVNNTIVTTSELTCSPATAGQTHIADFDGDGASDILYWRAGNGAWTYLSPAHSDGVTFNFGSSSFGDIPAPGDFDGDGITDAAVFRNSTGDWWLRRSTDGGGFISFPFGSPGDIPVPADYNGDGVSDIGVFRPSTGTWYIIYTGTSQLYIANFGINGDKPVPQDFDGDGKTDVAIFRPSNGTWFYLKSSDGNWDGLNWGLSGDIPVPADYDTDGKADITVFRPSNGTWYIMQSATSVPAFIQFGSNGDIPFPTDSNGDGIMELGVYRNNGAIWYGSGQPSFWWGAYGVAPNTPIKFLLPNS